MDLFLTANSRGEVSLHRSLDLQTVWTKSPPDSEVKLVQKLTWRPDSQAIAIAYSYNKAENSEDDLVSKAIVLVVTIENEDVNSINVEGDVTCLDWCETKTTSTVPACFTIYFPEPTPLSSTFCAGADLKKSRHLFKGKSEKTVNFLVIGSSIGDLKVLVSGFLLCCSLSVSSLIRLENKKYWIRNAVFSSDMKFMFVFIEERVDNITLTEVNAQVLILDTSVLSLRIAEINLLQTRIGQILTLVDRIKEVQSCLTEVWECLKVSEVASNFSKYQLHFESIESMVADICELIMFGVLSNSLEQFLLQSLNCNCVKKLIQSVKENCSNVETLISGHLKPFLEELLIILSEMKGVAELNQFRVLGLTTNFLSIASNNVRTLILKAAEFYVVVQSLEKMCTAFCQWLNLVITQLNSDEIQVLDTSEGLTENNLFLITDYLNSLCRISFSCDKPVSFFQHLGQYFDDICLLKPLEPHKWQRFLEDRIDLVTVAFFIPVSRTLSLAQVFKSCYESISNICSAPEKAISPTFSVKHVVDLPEMSSDCSTVESCYFMDNLTLVTGFVNQKNTGEFSLVEVSPHIQNNTKCRKVLKLGNENDFKCLDVKWCRNEKIYALFEKMEHGCGSLFLTQIEKPVINTLKSDYININSIKDGVLVWGIPYLTVSCFAVSGKRKFCVAVSKNKKKITTFDIWFDEESIEKDLT